MEETKEIVVEKNKREAGFEILRIISMFFICCVHILNHGGMLNNTGSAISNVLPLKFIYSLFTTSVNIFILISGYFMINKKLKIKRLVLLWFQVLFYSVTTNIIAILVFNKAFSWEDFLCSFVPILSANFWFISAYFIVYLISPFLNNMIKSSSKKQLKYLMIGIFIFVFISSRFYISGVASLSNGYSVLWFIILYITGAYLKLNPPQIKKFKIFIVYVACIALICVLFTFSQNSLCKPYYNTPLVYLASICIFLLFKDIYITNAKVCKVINFLSSCMFGVYLFHESFLRKYLFFNVLKVQNFYSSPIPSWINVLYLTFLIFTLSLIVEITRKVLLKFFTMVFKRIQSKNLGRIHDKTNVE